MNQISYDPTKTYVPFLAAKAGMKLMLVNDMHLAYDDDAPILRYIAFFEIMAKSEAMRLSNDDFMKCISDRTNGIVMHRKITEGKDRNGNPQSHEELYLPAGMTVMMSGEGTCYEIQPSDPKADFWIHLDDMNQRSAGMKVS